MRDLYEIVKTWPVVNGWSIAPEGTGFCDPGARLCIGAGCRWFTLAEALSHWGTHEQDRRLTMCLMESAKAIATLKGWRFE